MYRNNLITFCSLLLILACRCYGQSVTVTVERLQYGGDKLFFQSSDKTLCKEANAIYLSSSNNIVACQCEENKSYYSNVGYSPKCQSKSNDGSSPKIISTNRYLMDWSSNARELFYCVTPTFRLEEWNGNRFQEISYRRRNDLAAKLKPCSSIFCTFSVHFQWKIANPQYVMYYYSGKLFLVKVTCGSTEHQFLARAPGKRRYKVNYNKLPPAPAKPTFRTMKTYIHYNQPKSSSKKHFLTYVGVVIVVVVLKVLLCSSIYYRVKRTRHVITVRRLPTTQVDLTNRQNPIHRPNQTQANTNAGFQLDQTRTRSMDCPPSYTETVPKNVDACDVNALAEFTGHSSIQNLDQMDDVIAYSDTKPIITDK